MTQPATDEIDLQPGDRYDQFEIIRPLGRGSYARVFAARHPNYAQPIALKLSRVVLTTETQAIRALREIRALQSLDNPHVVKIHDHGVGSDERWYMVMELLEGQTLLEAHDFDVPMLPAEALHLIYQASVGLDEAHRQGIVHRDVKPENLWLVSTRRSGEPGQEGGRLVATGQLKVIDFGLARAWDPSVTVGEQATVGHMLIGTPHYAQPEQVHSGVLTPASDVYTLGIILYELLTGRVPFFPHEQWAHAVLRLAHKPVHWLSAHVKVEPTPIAEHPAALGLSPALRSLVHAMLAKEPEQRPASGGEVARQLAAILESDYGLAVAARLRTAGGPTERIIPGRHVLGEGCGDLALVGVGPRGDGPRELAKLDWLGPGSAAILTPLVHGLCQVDGQHVERALRLDDGATIEIGALRMHIDYPR